jgi:NADH-quinone oxidoreductase subunit H
MSTLVAVVNVLVFPGLLFLIVLGLAGQFVDRKLHARLQNRVGPPWFQPVADLFKLFGKEAVVPEEADRRMFVMAPVFALAAAIAAYLYVPLWSTRAVLSFDYDLVVVMYLLLIPTLTFFLGGWYARSVFSTIGAVRSITQLFAYEIPLFVGLLSPALLADTWSIGGMTAFYRSHPWYWLVNIPGFAVCMVSLLGKLERVPFDAPEAETEIVAGSFTEYSGRYLALFRMTIDSEAIVSSSLVAAVFLPFGLGLPAWLAFIVYLVKVGVLLFLLALLRTIFARLRIDQIVSFCWRWVAPIAFVQVIIDLVAKELLPR